MFLEQRHEIYGPKPWPIINNNYGLADTRSYLPRDIDKSVDLFCGLSERPINAIVRTHGKKISTKLIAKGLDVNEEILKKLAKTCPTTSPLTIIGSQARWVQIDSLQIENIPEREIEHQRRKLHLGYSRDEADIDIVVPDLPEVINLIVEQFPDSEFIYSRAAGDKLIIAKSRTTSGKEIEFHLFDDKLHPVVRNLVTAIDYPSTICIVSLEDGFYCTDLFGTSSQVGLFRVEIPLLRQFKKYHAEHPNSWREFNYALRKLLKSPRDGFYWHDTKQALEDIFNRFKNKELQPEEANSICKNFIESVKSWSPTSSDMNRETILMLGETDILKTIVESAIVSKNMEVIGMLYYSFGRTLEYYEPHKDVEITQHQLNDFKDLYKGNWGIVDPVEAILTCIRMSEFPIGWFKSINVGKKQYYNEKPNGFNYDHNKFTRELDDIFWEKCKKRKGRKNDLLKEPWPEDQYWNLGGSSFNTTTISVAPLTPSPSVVNII